MTLTRAGTLSFLGLSSLSARLRWNMFSPVVCFLHCASNADYLYVNLKESLAENAASPLAVGKSLSLRQSGGQLAQGNGRGSRPVTQLWFGIAVAAVLTDSPFGLRESPFPRFPLPPRKPPDSARSHTWCDSDSGSRRQVGTCPISVLEASPASSTSWPDFLMPPEPSWS